MKEKTKCSDKKSLNKYFYISQNFLSVEGDAFNEAHPAKERHGILFFLFGGLVTNYSCVTFITP